MQVLVRDVSSDIRVTSGKVVDLPELLPGESTELSVELALPGKRKEGVHKIFFKVHFVLSCSLVHFVFCFVVRHLLISVIIISALDFGQAHLRWRLQPLR